MLKITQLALSLAFDNCVSDLWFVKPQLQEQDW